jgi:hypothetical protein
MRLPRRTIFRTPIPDVERETKLLLPRQQASSSRGGETRALIVRLAPPLPGVSRLL